MLLHGKPLSSSRKASETLDEPVKTRDGFWNACINSSNAYRDPFNAFNSPVNGCRKKINGLNASADACRKLRHAYDKVTDAFKASLNAIRQAAPPGHETLEPSDKRDCVSIETSHGSSAALCRFNEVRKASRERAEASNAAPNACTSTCGACNAPCSESSEADRTRRSRPIADRSAGLQSDP